MNCLNFLSLWIYYISFLSIHPQKIRKKKFQTLIRKREEAISGDEEPSAAGTSLRLAKGRKKTVSC